MPAAPGPAPRAGRGVELAEIFRAHGTAHRQTHTLSRPQRRALHAIETCRTAAPPRHLGGDLGGTAILHTWGQNLFQHIHLHCVVTGGALAPDGARWIAAPPGFLFPVRALAKVFRGKYLAALRRAFAKGALRFAGSLAPLAEPAAFTAWLDQLRRPAWGVYAKRPSPREARARP